jgi:dTDP-4-amino-4,6-dideoxygalactose transaminase
MKSSPAQRRESFLVFGQPDIREEEIAEVVDTLKSGWLGTGPKTKRFEAEFAEFVGAKHAVAVNSCTAALHLSLLALGIGPGDEVITTPMTFASTLNVILHVGATPVLVDVDRTSMNIDPERVRAAVTERTRAILPVHMAGRPVDMDAVSEIADERGIAVVEDAAHAAEAVWRNRKIGSISPLTAFSFYVTKNLVTGEGGMVTTDDDALADDLRVRSLHGLSRDAWKRYSDSGFQPYDVILPGWKYNMTDMQAALGIHQLHRIGENHARREEIWTRYDAGFAPVDAITTPAPFEQGVHARHLYTILVDPAVIARDAFVEELRLRNIGAGVHFVAAHLHSYFRDRLAYRRGDFPEAEYISDRTVSLPLSSKLSDSDVDDVIAAVTSIIDEAH